MLIVLSLLLAVCDDDAQAGAAYRDALEFLRQGRYEEAVGKAQEAVRNQPRETDKLQYRDKDGRHKDPYYPHHAWAQARALQARGETNLAHQRQLFREAITHLELTLHPSAPALLDTLKGELAAVEKRAAVPVGPDPALVALRRKIDSLCDDEHFEEALQAVAAEKALLDRMPAERNPLLEGIQTRRSAVIVRYERALELALETVAVASPLEKPESIPVLLQPALLPRTVADPTEGRFVWLREFLATYQEQLPLLRAFAGAEGPRVLQGAQSFEQAAGRGLKVGSFAGFRAALNVAQTLRLARIQSLSAGLDDAQLDRLLVTSEEALRQSEKCLGASPEHERYRTGVLAPHAARLKEAKERMFRRTQLAVEIERWIGQADRSLAQSSAMADPEALRGVVTGLARIENLPEWKDSPARLRSKALFARALLEAVSVLLEGGALDASLAPAAARIRSARALDAGVDDVWRDRLSPKLKTWLGRMDR